MNPYLDKPHSVFSSNPSEIAVNLWKSRFDLSVGGVANVTFGYSISVHRLSESEFIIVVSNLDHTETGKVLDVIREHSGV